MKKEKIVHVSFQDPNRMTGGQGVSVLNTAKAQLALGYPVDYISLRIKGESTEQKYRYPEGTLPVYRISIFDSDIIETPYAGTECRQTARREEFYCKVTEKIKQNYNKDDTFIHLHGFYYDPLIAGAIPEYNVSSTYNLLLTARMDRTGENKDIMYDMIKMFEIVSFYTNRKIHATSPGMKDEILEVASAVKDPYFKEGALRLAERMRIQVPGLKEATAQDLKLEDRIWTISHGVGNEFFSEPLSQTKKGRVVAWGRISPEKGFEYLIGTARELRDMDFLIWGTTRDTERKRRAYKKLLLNRAAGLPNVKLDLREGGVRGNELLSLIDSGEIVVIPSLYEPFGLVNIEALARGKPIIATTTTGGRYIMDSENPGILPYGYLIEADTQRLAEEITACLRHFAGLSFEEKQKMSKAASERAKEFSWANKAQRIMEMYRSL